MKKILKEQFQQDVVQKFETFLKNNFVSKVFTEMEIFDFDIKFKILDILRFTSDNEWIKIKTKIIVDVFSYVYVDVGRDQNDIVMLKKIYAENYWNNYVLSGKENCINSVITTTLNNPIYSFANNYFNIGTIESIEHEIIINTV